MRCRPTSAARAIATTALTRLVLERKEDMRRRGAKSPDEWDAVALTFAKPVAALVPKKPSNFHRKLVYQLSVVWAVVITVRPARKNRPH